MNTASFAKKSRQERFLRANSMSKREREPSGSIARFRKSAKLDDMREETKEEFDGASNLAFARRKERVANPAR